MLKGFGIQRLPSVSYLITKLYYCKNINGFSSLSVLGPSIFPQKTLKSNWHISMVHLIVCNFYITSRSCSFQHITIQASRSSNHTLFWKQQWWKKVLKCYLAEEGVEHLLHILQFLPLAQMEMGKESNTRICRVKKRYYIAWSRRVLSILNFKAT